MSNVNSSSRPIVNFANRTQIINDQNIQHVTRKIGVKFLPDPVSLSVASDLFVAHVRHSVSSAATNQSDQGSRIPVFFYEDQRTAPPSILSTISLIARPFSLLE